MRRIIVTVLLVQLAVIVNAQYQTQANEKGAGFYLNPVFAGDYPDPGILCDGDDYYMVHSSFEYYPGLLIWHSKDLINWSPVKNTLYKFVGSVWAPDLVKYRNRYYIYFPANNTNYIVYADSINGKWSDPVDLKIGNIDPGHVTDANGKRYLFFSSGGFIPLSDEGLSTAGELKGTYSGWPIPLEWSIECFCLEGPKLVKRGEYYYLTVAEGGTAGPVTGHMVVSARSKSLSGPWENSPYNPITRTKNNAERWCSERMLNNQIVGAHFHSIDLSIHGTGHMVRAVQEGIAFSFRYGLDIMRENGINPTVVRAGKANLFLSDVFAQSFANVNNVAVEFYEGDGSFGAAIGAGIGAGVYRTAETALQNRKPAGAVTPADTGRYDELYEQWKERLSDQLNRTQQTKALSFSKA